MARRIEKIKLNRFRGATKPFLLELDSQKHTVLIFGENGTGKSTIVDALDIASNGGTGSLEEVSAGTYKQKYLESLGGTGDLEVILTSGGNESIGRLKTSGIIVSDPHHIPVIRVLRRSQILKVVNAEPKKRYEELRGFVSVPNIEASEKTLSEALKEVGRDHTEEVKAKNEAEEKLRRFWVSEGSADGSPVNWASKRLKQAPAGLELEIKNLETVIKNYDSLDEEFASFKEIQEESEKIRKVLAKVQKDIKAKKDKKKEVDEALIELLQSASDYLGENEKLESCPVCEQPFKAKTLKMKIDKRLELENELVTLLGKQKEAEGEMKESLTSEKESRKSIAPLANKLLKAVSEYQKALSPVIKIKESDFFPLGKEDAIKDSQTKLSKFLLDIVNKFSNEISKKLESNRKEKEQWNSVEIFYKSYQEKQEKAKELEATQIWLNKSLEILSGSRKRFVDEVLKDVSQTVKELYEKIHPGEPLGNFQLQLDERFQGSLDLKGRFGTAKDILPQAYYSESHLDSLGICVFLALAIKFKTEVVVLDDVFSSTDDPHIERFMDLLHSLQSNFPQILLTTHYRPLLDRYRYGRGPVGNIQLVELLFWSVEEGVRHTKSKLAVEELKAQVESSHIDRQAVGSKSGVVLESLLNHWANLYGLNLPAGKRPTLGNYFDAITSKLKSKLTVEKLKEDGKTTKEIKELKEVIDKLNAFSWVRNQVGAHFDFSSLSDVVVKEYGICVLELAAVIVCDNCGALPKKNRSGSYFECHCSLTRLHPIQIPD